MAKPKSSIKRDSVFGIFRKVGGTSTPKQGIQKPEPQMRQTAVWLSDDETDWLDSRLQEIKRGGWRGVTRSAFIRALIRASMEQQIEVEGISGEAELTDRLIHHS